MCVRVFVLFCFVVLFSTLLNLFLTGRKEKERIRTRKHYFTREKDRQTDRQTETERVSPRGDQNCTD